MKTNMVFLMLVIVSCCSVSLAVEYEWLVNPANGHKYALTDWGPWVNCEAEAVAQGGHLVTINDPMEHHWLMYETPLCSSYMLGAPGVPGCNASWVGMYYDGVGNIHSLDSWKWLTGETGTDFLGTTPEFYVYDGIHMHITGTYHPFPGLLVNGPHADLDPCYYLQGIIEVVPEPGTLSLLTVGIVAALRRKKH